MLSHCIGPVALLSSLLVCRRPPPSSPSSLCRCCRSSAAARRPPLFAWLIVKLSHRPQRPPLFVAVAARLLPPDALLSSWLIEKSLHQLRCPPLFVAVANHLPPPDALLLRRRCLHCHAAANFIDVPPLPSSLHRCYLLEGMVTSMVGNGRPLMP